VARIDTLRLLLSAEIPSDPRRSRRHFGRSSSASTRFRRERRHTPRCTHASTPCSLRENALARQTNREAHLYEVAVIRCPDQGTSLFLNYGYLDDASQQEVNSVRYQAKNPGVTNQVRLSKITSVSPKITTLLSQWTDPC
jgi:hypothetical protein